MRVTGSTFNITEKRCSVKKLCIGLFLGMLIAVIIFVGFKFAPRIHNGRIISARAARFLPKIKELKGTCQRSREMNDTIRREVKDGEDKLKGILPPEVIAKSSKFAFSALDKAKENISQTENSLKNVSADIHKSQEQISNWNLELRLSLIEDCLGLIDGMYSDILDAQIAVFEIASNVLKE